MSFRNTNPVYKKVMNDNAYGVASNYLAASYLGVAKKAFYFIACVFVGAFGGLFLMKTNPQFFVASLTISIVTTFIFAFLGLASPRLSKVCGTIYCLGEGMLVGVVSLLFEAEAPGVVITALLSVVVVLAITITLFMTNIVKVNGKFLRFLIIFAISMMVSYLLIYLISIFTNATYNMGTILMVSGLSVFLATLYLFFDLEAARQVVEGGAPKEMEWFVAFGMVYTLVWLYTEVLRIVFIILDNR